MATPNLGKSPAAAHLGSALAVGLYLTALALIVQGVAHALIMGGTAAPVWSIRWRFGFMGSVFSNLAFPLLGLAVASLTAALVSHRGMLKLLGLTQVTLAVGALLAFGLFLLDSAQIGAIAPPDLRSKFAITVGKTSVDAALGFVVLTILGVATFRASRLGAPTKSSSRPRADALVVGRH